MLFNHRLAVHACMEMGCQAAEKLKCHRFFERDFSFYAGIQADKSTHRRIVPAKIYMLNE